jgi:DNA-binding response OmpR family regulator
MEALARARHVLHRVTRMTPWERRGPLHVLVLDDDVDVGQAICDVLGQERHVARAVQDLATAWQAIRHGPPDVLVADYHIGMTSSGLLLATVRQNFPGVRRLLVSSSPPREWSYLVDRGLVHGTLMKPFVAHELIELVEALSIEVKGMG